MSISASSRVFLYNGEGADSVFVAEAQRWFCFNGMDPVLGDFSLIQREWSREGSEINSLCIGGGDSPTISIDVMTEGNRTIIQTQVYKGKSYIGICAGAICAVNKFQQYPERGTKELPGSLRLTDICAKGLCCFSDQYPRNFKNDSFETAKGVVVQHAESEVPVYWDLGPAFETCREEVVATYSLPNGKNPAAVVSTRFGSGSVVLSGVHPEIVTDKDVHVKIRDVVNRDLFLLDGIEGQRNLFRDICRRAGILPLPHREPV